MSQKITYLSILLVCLAGNIFAQPSIDKLTRSIINTDSTKYEQAKALYYWVTNNIKYDLKKLEEGNFQPIKPEELIKKKKGTCYDFASLYQALCKSAGINSYLVMGYSKGYGHSPFKPFLRANHTWNVIETDGKFVMVDATWGAGYIDFKPSLYSKALNVTTAKAYTNDKVLFQKEKSSNYFDVPVEKIPHSHYPLDPKWLISDNPFSFDYFNTDTIFTRIDQSSYRNEIAKIKDSKLESQYMVEGKRSYKHNPLNHFDIAWSKLLVANEYDIVRSITERKLPDFESYLEDFTNIVEHIQEHRQITDSVYKERYSSLKLLASTQKRLSNKISSNAKSAQKAFQSAKKTAAGRNTTYNKKIGGYSSNIIRYKNKKMELLEPPGPKGVDSAEFLKMKGEIDQLVLSYPPQKLMLDSLKGIIKIQIMQDVNLDKNTNTNNSVLNNNIISLNTCVLKGNEVAIRLSADSVSEQYTQVDSLLDNKKLSKTGIENTGRKYFKVLNSLQKAMKQEISLRKKHFKMSNFNEDILANYNQTIDSLVKSYEHAIGFTEILASYNTSQKDIRKQNLSDLKAQRKSAKKAHKYFVAWYDNLYEREKNAHALEKNIMSEIKANAQKKRKAVEVKLKRYYAQNDD